MNDAFIFSIIQFIEGDYVKRLSNDAVAQITTIGAYYIQFKMFTYLRVVGTIFNPKNIPSYPCDRLILLEISRQLESECYRVKKQHKPCWTWPFIIGPFQVK